jgi:hypothetical protein
MQDDLGDAPMSNGTHPPAAFPTGSPPQARRAQRTGSTVGIPRHKTQALGTRVHLPGFARPGFALPESYPLGTQQHPIVLQHK